MYNAIVHYICKRYIILLILLIHSRRLKISDIVAIIKRHVIRDFQIDKYVETITCRSIRHLFVNESHFQYAKNTEQVREIMSKHKTVCRY